MSLRLRPFQTGDEEAALRWSRDRQFCLINEWTLDLWQDLKDGKAELGIAIGDSGLWGQGIAAQAGQLMLAWAFEDLALQRV